MILSDWKLCVRRVYNSFSWRVRTGTSELIHIPADAQTRAHTDYQVQERAGAENQHEVFETSVEIIFLRLRNCVQVTAETGVLTSGTGSLAFTLVNLVMVMPQLY